LGAAVVFEVWFVENDVGKHRFGKGLVVPALIVDVVILTPLAGYFGDNDDDVVSVLFGRISAALGEESEKVTEDLILVDDAGSKCCPCCWGRFEGALFDGAEMLAGNTRNRSRRPNMTNGTMFDMDIILLLIILIEAIENANEEATVSPPLCWIMTSA